MRYHSSVRAVRSRMGKLLPSTLSDEIMENESLLDTGRVQDLEDIWVFGYGSILWNPGFSYECRRSGFVEGYARRFWQGSTTHRGTPQSPGRVVTLVPHTGSRTWGMAFYVVGSAMVKACLERLGLRECHLGGYCLQQVTFTELVTETPRSSQTSERLRAHVFIATPSNHLYLGPATVDQLAQQVVKCVGLSGSNAEYVTKLADFVRHHIPQDDDQELFQLDAQVRRLLAPSQTDVNHSKRRASVIAAQPLGVFDDCDVSDKEMLVYRRSSVEVTVLAG